MVNEPKTRPNCGIEGCHNLARIRRHNSDGTPIFDSTCSKHRIDGTVKKKKKPPKGTKCEIDGCNFTAQVRSRGKYLCTRHKPDGSLHLWITNGGEKKAKRLSKWKNYGIILSMDEYKQRIVDQGNRCAICDCDFSDLNTEPCVDHDHLTGRVRGIICPRCNWLMSFVDSGLIYKCLEYKEVNG